MQVPMGIIRVKFGFFIIMSPGILNEVFSKR